MKLSSPIPILAFFLSLAPLALFAASQQSHMLITVPRTTETITVDGNPSEKAWSQATVLANFLQATENQFAPENTSVKLLHDHKNLYLFFTMNAFALDSASNQMASFKADHTKHDANIWADDSMEVRLEKDIDGLPTYICFNANGAILDMRYENNTWVKSWHAKTDIKANRANGKWQAELAIDLKSLGMTDFDSDGRNWKLNLIRFDQRLKKTYSLVRLTNGNHSSIENYAKLSLDTQANALANLEQPLDSERIASGNVPIRTTKPIPVCAKAKLWNGSKVIASTKTTFKTGQGILPLPTARTNADYFLQLELTEPNGRLISRSTTLPFRSLARELSFSLDANGPFELQVNGKTIAPKEKHYRNLRHPLSPGNNTIRILSSDNNPVHGTITCLDNAFPVTGDAWKQPFHIMNKVTTFLPLLSDNTWHLTQQGTYILFWDGSCASRWDAKTQLNAWQLTLDVPEQLEFLGATYRNHRTARTRATEQGLPRNEHLYAWKAIGTINHEGTTYRQFTVRRTKPVTLTHDKETWLRRIVRQDDGCYLAFKAIGQPGTIPPIRFKATAQQGLYQELTNTLNVEILPELKGSMPQCMSVMLKNLDGGLADSAIANHVFDTIKAAGVNEYFGECNTDYLKRIGVKHFNYFNLHLHPHEANFTDAPLQKLFQDHPRAKAKGSSGINPAYINRHPETWPYLEQAIAALKAGQPSLSAAWWDYEFSPFPGHLMIYPCFDPEAQAEFAKRHNLKAIPTYEDLNTTYRSQWIDFSCEEIATMFKHVRTILHRQHLPLYVYSGYQGCPNGKEYYNIDWNHAGKHVDRAYCGYNPTPQELNDTKQSLHGKPLIGALLKMGLTAQADVPGAMVLKAITHGGGVLLWYQNRYDGIALTNIAKASNALAKLDHIRQHDVPLTNAVKATPENRLRVQLWQTPNSDSYTLVAINDRNQPKTFNFKLTQGTGMYEGAGQRFKVSPNAPVKLTVPAGETWFLRRRP